MEEFIWKQVLVFLSFWILSLFVIKVRRAMHDKDEQATPSEAAKEKLFREIKRMKEEGRPYGACLEELKRKGFRKGTSRMIILEAERHIMATRERKQKNMKDQVKQQTA